MTNTKSAPYLTMSEDEIAMTITRFIFPDKQEACRTGQYLADGIVNKKPFLLAEILSGGAKWNPNSKKGFCHVLGKPTVLTKKAMDAMIAEHCEITVEKYHRLHDFLRYQSRIEHSAESICDKYGNGDEAISGIVDFIHQGFTKLGKAGGKHILTNQDESDNRCVHLPHTLFKKIAEEYMELQTILKDISDYKRVDRSKVYERFPRLVEHA